MMKEIKIGAYIKGEESYEFNFYTDLSIKDKTKFVNSVIKLVVDDTHYNSLIKDLVFDFYTIKYFTDVDVSELEQSLNFLDDVEEFLYETNIVEIVQANAFPTLFDELNKAVDDSIEYLTGVHKNLLNDSLSSLLSSLEKKIDEVNLNDMMKMAQKFANMTGEFTTDNIVNAYISSNVHKNNLAEIVENKKNKKNEIKIDEDLGEAVRTVVEENKAENKVKSKARTKK